MAFSTDDAKAITRSFLRDYPAGVQLAYLIRDTVEDLYGAEAAKDLPKGFKGGYVPKETSLSGKSYLGRVDVAVANATDSRDFLVTLRHEVLGHYGSNTFKPEEKRSLLDSIIESKDQPILNDLWKKVEANYPGESLLMQAEEVFALNAEQLAPIHHVNNHEVKALGAESLKETCFDKTRTMAYSDLQNISLMVAEGLHDRSLTQQTFPNVNDILKRNDDMATEEQAGAKKPAGMKKPFHETVAENLIDQLKAGTAPWQKPWDANAATSMMPFNPTTGNNYKGINRINLMSQGREDTRWLTYNQAGKLGGQVRKGEKSTPVQFWKYTEEQNKLDDNGKPVLDANGDNVKVQVKLERPKVFYASVFNAEQIDGLEPMVKKEQTWDASERAENILAASGAKIEHGGNRAFYSPGSDYIQMPERGQFDQSDKYYATALHELGHWTGHETRLDRDLKNPFGSEGYAKEELRAEIASMIIGDELGIGHDPGQHVAYVASWIKALEEDPLEIFRAASDAEKIQGFVMNFEQDLKQEQDQVNELPEYQTQALEFLSYNYDKAELSEQDVEFLDRAAAQGDAPIVAAMELAEKDSLKLNEQGFVYGATDRMSHGLSKIRDSDALSLTSKGVNDEDLNVFVFNSAISDFRHVIGVDYQMNAAEVLSTVSKASGEELPADREQFIKEVLELPDDLLKQVGLDKEIKSYKALEENMTRQAENQAQTTQAEKSENSSKERTYIDVPFKEKNEAKELGAKWDRKEKSWYVPAGGDANAFSKWTADANAEKPAKVEPQAQAAKEQATTEPASVSEREYLAVPFSDKDEAKQAGAKWDKGAKSWYAGPEADMAVLSKWKPENVEAEQGPAMTPEAEFADAMQSLGLDVSGKHPIMDGKPHRVKVDGDKGSEAAGFYVGHLDGHPAGYIKNNKTGQDEKWKSKGYSLNPEEKAKLQAEAATKLAEREAKLEQTQQAAADRVTKQAEGLTQVEQATPYLVSKNIKVHEGILTDADNKTTFIPATDADGKHWTTQYINEDGSKRFAKESKKEGAFHVVGGMEALAAAPALVIAEGYATAATLAEGLGHATVAGFDSGNLPAVAEALHAKFPDKPVIIAGDDDRHLEMTQGSNPGREKAVAAANKVGGVAIFPVFAPGENSWPKDVPAVTPQTYKAHHETVAKLESNAKLEDGDDAKLSADDKAELEGRMLSGDQLKALSQVKRFTDFNDLANISELGRNGVDRQVTSSVDMQVEKSEKLAETKSRKVDEDKLVQTIQPKPKKAMKR